MKTINNSGCVSKSIYQALRARDTAKRESNNMFDIYSVKKNGDLYKKPVFDYGFKTREEAETKKSRLEDLNPNTKFEIVER